MQWGEPLTSSPVGRASLSENPQIYYETVVRLQGYSSKRRLRYHTKYIIGDVSSVKTALEIGGGAGVLSFYIASQGATKVVCLEPEAAGSTESITRLFRKIQAHLPFGDRVMLEAKTFQDYDPRGETFDFIVLHNSINHLNEDACIDLKTNKDSYEAYMGYFKNLYDMLESGGRLVVADCSPYNLFQALRLRNPFMPTIEWRKHQSPYQWKKMLEKVGFVRPRIQWTAYNSLGLLGPLIMGNPVASYLTISHFKLTLWKP